MLSKSDVTGEIYEQEDCVFFRNYIQAAYYIEWGCRLIDIFTDSKHKLVFVFTKEEHQKYISRWMDRKEELGLS